MRYKAPRPSLRHIANDLNVQGFISGTVMRTDNSRIGVRVEFIDARTERQLWSDNFIPDARSVVDVQRQIVRNIVREARINVTPHQRRRLEAAGRSTDTQAYDSVVKARAESARINYPIAVEYYEKALSRDPEMAQAWAELALTLVYQAYGDSRNTVIARARAAADRALELDPDNAEARVALRPNSASCRLGLGRGRARAPIKCEPISANASAGLRMATIVGTRTGRIPKANDRFAVQTR